MSYEKSTIAVSSTFYDALVMALQQNSIVIDGLADELLAAGTVVRLDGTGPLVWVSCVSHDRPSTPEIDFMTIAVALSEDGSPRFKTNGQVVAHPFWANVWPAVLADLTVNVVRKALMMVALGEPQPQVPIPNPDPEPAPQVQDAVPMATPEAHSIRLQISSADQLAAPPADVL